MGFANYTQMLKHLALFDKLPTVSIELYALSLTENWVSVY